MSTPDRSRTLPAAVVRELDRLTIQELGIPGLILMENAGQEAARHADLMLRAADLDRCVLIGGRGNNAGDAFVVARHLHNLGYDCTIALVGDESSFDPASDAGMNLQAAQTTGIEVVPLEPERITGQLADLVQNGALLVDGLLGTGIRGPLRLPFPTVIDAMNACGQPILALDLPSGIDADSGEITTTAIRASVTVTFGVAKPGLFQGEGPDCAGRVELALISIPRHLIEKAHRDLSS